MAAHHDRIIEKNFRRAERRLPWRRGAVWLRWMRNPKAARVRIPVAILLIVAGFLGFLPILGFWMVPIGVLLLAVDLPFLRPPAARTLRWGEARWRAWKARRRSRP